MRLSRNFAFRPRCSLLYHNHGHSSFHLATISVVWHTLNELSEYRHTHNHQPQPRASGRLDIASRAYILFHSAHSSSCTMVLCCIFFSSLHYLRRASELGIGRCRSRLGFLGYSERRGRCWFPGSTQETGRQDIWGFWLGASVLTHGFMTAITAFFLAELSAFLLFATYVLSPGLIWVGWTHGKTQKEGDVRVFGALLSCGVGVACHWIILSGRTQVRAA